MKEILKLAFLLVLAVFGNLWGAERPNILFIFTDDQSHRTVSCYEDALGWAKTPNIDRLAREGIRFKHAFAGPWCAPLCVSPTRLAGCQRGDGYGSGYDCRATVQTDWRL